MARRKCPHCRFFQDVRKVREGQSIQCVNCKKMFQFHASAFPAAKAKKKEEVFPTRPSFQKNHRLSPPTPRRRKRPSFSIDGYDIIDELGKGGMGSVYLAEQKSLGRKVAIKVLDPGLARQQASILRFTKEAAAMATLSHPNIVYVIDRGVSRQRYYFVMEFIDGCSLRDLLREGPFVPKEALQIILQLTKTMEYAHEKGVIHRDLKPENILYTNDSILKLADFGLVSVQQETTHIRKLTKSHVSMGTECYMAPEQRRDAKNVDHRADIYSIGVILHELVTHRLPFPHLPAPEQEIVKGYPKVDTIIRRCLETDPLKRFATTAELKEALVDAIQTEKQPIYDTVIETPAVPSYGKESKKKDSFLLWPTRIKDSVRTFGTQVKQRFQKDGKKQFAWTGGILAAFAVLVLSIAVFVPRPQKTGSKHDSSKNWTRVAAIAKQLKNQSTMLQFLFQNPKSIESWGKKTPEQWILRYGNWGVDGRSLSQNTYVKGMTLNHRNCWALYKGHRLDAKGLMIDSTVSLLRPYVSTKGDKVPLHLHLKQSRNQSLKKARRYPTIGLGVRGVHGAELSFLLRPHKGDIRYFFRVRSKGKRTSQKIVYSRFRTFDGFTKESFRYEKKLRLSLKINNNEASALVNGKLVEKIQLRRSERFHSYAGLICRDAHCNFQKFQIQAFTSTGQDG